MSEEQWQAAKKLARDHFTFVRQVLSTHGIDPNLINVVNFHYEEAFVHGYKHGYNDAIDFQMIKQLGNSYQRVREELPNSEGQGQGQRQGLEQGLEQRKKREKNHCCNGKKVILDKVTKAASYGTDTGDDA